MSLESSTETLRNRIGEDCGLNATLKFDFGADGKLFIDATQVPNVVTNDDTAAQCTVSVTLADFDAMMAGDLAPTTAFMSGTLKVEGDMGVAMKLQNIM
jgi:putative sterol carrier protein